ncbi:MAG: hypothetical protein ACO1OQ_03370 [Rufibacter sp.]
MLKNLLNPFRSAIYSLAVVTLLASCDSNDAEPMPEAAPLETQFSLVDSIKVSDYYKTAAPETYASMNGQTYKVSSQNQAEVYFYEDQDGLTLYIKENSKGKENPWLSFTFKNRTAANLPASLSLKDANLVCVEEGQQFSDGSMAMSPGCASVLDGTMTLVYDEATGVLSGTVKNLKFGIGYYVPSYSFPNHAGLVLSSSGSSRNVDFSFKNAQRLKM